VTTDDDLARLVEACRSVPMSAGDYQQHDYITNVLLTVLDLQMHNVAVNNSIQHYWDHRWGEIRTLADLEVLLVRHPNDHDGNRAISQYLWGNNYGNRVEWLRGLVSFLRAEGLATEEELESWARTSDFHRDFEGRAKYLGIAAYQWLVMRLGVDTVKPDVMVRNFVEPIVGHPVSDDDLVSLVTQAAEALDLSPRKLDAAIWEYQRGAPGTV